jgi:hypothetical protein
LKYRSKDKYQYIGYDFLYYDNTIFKQKVVRKLFSIEIVIFHKNGILEGYATKYQRLEVASKNFKKGPFKDYQTAFCSPLALTVLEKIFLKNLLFYRFVT